MFDLASWPFDTSGFVTREKCGEWSDGLIWMHIGGDLFIWLAYISIPLVLLYFVRRRELPFPRLFTLFALFILACGFGHLIEAMMFSYPLYRLAGVWKVVTAVVSWATVFALIPIVPRVMEVVRASTSRHSTGDTTLHRLAALGSFNRLSDYVVAILAALLSLLVRWAIDPIVTSDHFYVVPLLAVVFVSWWCGFGPGILTLILSMFGIVYYFLDPRGRFIVNGISSQLATAAFFFCGVSCALLGEAQRLARKRTKVALEIALERKGELEAEVARRRQIELELRQSEATLRAFYESAPVPMGIVEPLENDLVHVLDNVASSRLFGVEPGATAGRRASALGTPPGLLALWLNHYRESGRRGEPVRFEYEFEASQGTRWLSATVSPIGTDPRGRKLFCYVAEDATEQKRAEEAIRKSEESFRTLADNISQFAWTTDETGWIGWYNRRWFDYTGTTLEEMQGWGWRAVQHPDHVERVVDKFASAIKKGEVWEDTFPLRGRDGEYRWFLSRANPIRNAKGKIVQWFGTNTDITEQRNLEEALREAAERYQTLTEAIPKMVWNTDAEGEVTYFNRRWLKYTEVTVEEARGGGWTRAIHVDDRERVYAAWQATVNDVRSKNEDQFAQELRLKNAANNTYRWFLTRAVPLRRTDGTVDQWIVSMADIHQQKTVSESLDHMVRDRTADLLDEIEERRRAEQQVRSVAAELARSNGELEQFAYVASHDLQEPLRKIQAFGDRLRTRYRAELPDAGKEYVDLMHTAAGRMRRLIDDLLNYSRVTTMARPFQTIDLKKLVMEVVNDLEVQVEHSGGTVEVKELPEVDADPTQMRQLFQNLIANALKFRKPDISPQVTVRGEVATAVLPGAREPITVGRITVTDNGIGFDEKYLDRIFQMFQRLHGRNEYEGTGIGLAICRKIAERHGGTITGQSRSGEGATFVVTLPLRHSREETTPDVQSQEDAGNHSGGR